MAEYNSVSDYEVLIERATELRKNPTYAEKILWSKLKNGLSGYDFLFQVVMVPFIPDFVCLSAKLIIELDGEVHDFQRNYDEDRDINLAVSGYKILRFSNNEIIENSDEVLRQILFECSSRDPLPIRSEGLLALKNRLANPKTIDGDEVVDNSSNPSLPIIECTICKKFIHPIQARVKDWEFKGWKHKKC